MTDLPALGAGEARALCAGCGPIELDSLTVQYLPRTRILHYTCGKLIRLFVGPETKIAIHSHTCGHAIAVPYRDGQDIPPTPGCSSLHAKGGPLI